MQCTLGCHTKGVKHFLGCIGSLRDVAQYELFVDQRIASDESRPIPNFLCDACRGPQLEAACKIITQCSLYTIWCHKLFIRLSSKLFRRLGLKVGFKEKRLERKFLNRGLWS